MRFLLTGLLFVACSKTENTNGNRYHPDGWAAKEVHGQAMRVGEQDCTSCHGADLLGASASKDVSCDSCHMEGWRTDCTYCHGAADNDSGAPPRGLDDSRPNESLAFTAHSRHVQGERHLALECAACHVQPDDVLSPGHAFDDTPGQVEVDFSGGLSPQADWDSNGSCSNLYCHGNGRSNGEVETTDTIPGCQRCHANRQIGLAWLSMSGEHGKHLFEGVFCESCHAATVDTNNQLIDVSLHVNGSPDVVLDGATLQANGRCDGRCHGENHNNENW